MFPDITIWIDTVSVAIDILGVSVILLGITLGFLELLLGLVKHLQPPNRYDLLRIRIGKALLLGLEILVASDVIRTVALQPTLQNLIILGVLIIIRTVLSWTLFIDIENRWPWQRAV
jgi:uncharacterized membrane protein